MNCDRLISFRQDVYQLLNFAKDATFELMDAVLTTRKADCLADFSLNPLFRRKWPSIYEALQDCRPNRNKLMRRYIEEINVDNDEHLLMAIDHTPWPRKYSPTLKDGNKFKLNDTKTWWLPDQERVVQHPKLGSLKVKTWKGLHFRYSPSATMNLILVERLDGTSHSRLLKPLWLVWIGENMPSLELIWAKYLRRFTVEHWYRFIKQRLHWTLPALTTPQQCERWSDLMPALTWELWLAKTSVRDKCLPWQKPQTKLTPGRVAQSMLGLITEIGTPATSPKLRGNSSGWEKGRKRSRRTRYPIIKKGFSGNKKG